MSSMLTFESRFPTYIVFFDEAGVPVALVSKSDLVQLANFLFSSLILDFPIVSSILVCVSIINSSLEFSSFFLSKFFKM